MRSFQTHHRWTKDSVLMSLQTERIYFHSMYQYCLANYSVVPLIHRVCLMPCFFAFFMSCLICFNMGHFWQMNQILFTHSVCIIEVDLYLHVTFDVNATSSRRANAYIFQESKSSIGKYYFFKSKY